MTIRFETHSAAETRALGSRFADLLTPGVVVVMIGGLGAGKTALSQGIAEGLGISSRVTSPTFTMVATYDVDGRRGIAALLHADLYRVTSGSEADDLSIGELVEERAVALVEWGDVAPDVLGGRQVIVSISLGDSDDDRFITIDDRHRVIDKGVLEEALDRWKAQ
jgi:tRNA threonylcarbamoyladenosine biosynthesis protein TsaE